VPYRLSHFLDNQLTSDSEVVSVTRQPPYISRKIPDLISVRGRLNSKITAWLERLGQLNIQMTSAGIETTTFQLGISLFNVYSLLVYITALKSSAFI
jgi:hypothetical protein